MVNDIANYIKTELGGIGSYTAGTTVAEVDTKTFLTKGFGSGEVSLGYVATLQTDESFSATLKLETSKDGTTWATPEVLYEDLEVVTAEAAETLTGQVNAKLNLTTRDKYVRFNVTPELTADDTDVVKWSLSLVLGGSDSIPV